MRNNQSTIVKLLEGWMYQSLFKLGLQGGYLGLWITSELIELLFLLSLEF